MAQCSAPANLKGDSVRGSVDLKGDPVRGSVDLKGDPVRGSVDLKGDPVRESGNLKGDPVRVSVDLKGDPVCVSVDLKGDPVRVSVDLKGDPVRVSVDLKGDPVRVSVDLKGDPVCVSVDLKERQSTGKLESSRVPSPRISSAPVFVKGLCDLQVMDGSQVVMNVEVTAHPPAEILWFHNGKEIQETEDFHFERSGDTYYLYIQEVFPEDTGMYTCEAWNSLGQARTEAMLTVQGVEPHIHYSYKRCHVTSHYREKLPRPKTVGHARTTPGAQGA
ncbi:unnamed protein product, partial [Ranitomeya imitator]